MIPRPFAIAAAVVALIACVLASSILLRPSADRESAVPSAENVSKPVSAKPLPAPTGTPVVKISGVEKGNVGPHTTRLDLATMDQLGAERLTVHEPFLKRDVTFTGVWLRELMGRAGVPERTDRLYLHALDDYHVELATGDLSAAFLAVRANGEPIEIADGGPVRLVFASDEGMGANTDNWIWSIDSIRAIP